VRTSAFISSTAIKPSLTHAVPLGATTMSKLPRRESLAPWVRADVFIARTKTLVTTVGRFARNHASGSASVASGPAGDCCGERGLSLERGMKIASFPPTFDRDKAHHASYLSAFQRIDPSAMRSIFLLPCVRRTPRSSSAVTLRFSDVHYAGN
jgi:hypothetical protein